MRQCPTFHQNNIQALETAFLYKQVSHQFSVRQSLEKWHSLHKQQSSTLYSLQQLINSDMNKALSIRRKEKDIFKLRSANYEVLETQTQSTYHVEFKGPKSTPYEKGKWLINLYLPEEYPYKSPSVGFLNKIFHPNIDYGSGSVCLDVINQTWTPMYELVNIFQIFLPQLLTYPNPSSPLNHDAAQLYQKNQESYNKKVRQCVLKYALNEQFKEEGNEPIEQQIEQHESSSEEGSCSLSDYNSAISSDNELNLY